MSNFHRVSVDDVSFIRGAARLLWAGTTVAFPTSISDVVDLTSFNAATGWNDLGATKNGIQITRNNAEESFDVDQIQGAIATMPTDWTVQVGTSLAEMTLERLQIAWEAGPVSLVGSEKQMGIGAPEGYVQRRLAVVYRRPDNPMFGGTGGKMRAYVFRKAQRTPQESAVTHNKTGEQISIPVLWSVLADTSITDILSRFFMIFDQV